MLNLRLKPVFAIGALLLAVSGLAFFAVISRPQAPLVVQPPVTQKSRPIEQVRDPNRLFGYIKSIQHQDDKVFVEFDLAELLGRSGTDTSQVSAADLAAFEDGQCPGHAYPTHDCLDIDFYIRNNDPSTRLLELSNSVQIISLHYQPSGDYAHVAPLDLTGFSKPKAIDFREFETIFKLVDVPGTGYGARDTYNAVVPYLFTLKGGKVVKIEEAMTP
jgi:hypothetical protein